MAPARHALKGANAVPARPCEAGKTCGTGHPRRGIHADLDL